MTLVDLRRGSGPRPAPEERSRSRARRASGWVLRRPELPWCAAAGLGVWILVLAGNPVIDPLLYGLYWVVAVAVPGVLLFRAFMGSRSLPEDLGFGAVLGLAWQLIGWFVLTAWQLQSLLWVWPTALILAFAAVPALRRHWRVAERTPLAWSWAAAGSMVVALLVLYVSWLRDTDLPPHTRLLEPDLWYHLSINGELTRTIFPHLPYVAEESLEYHWFANVHMASGQLMTGIEPASILLHLWLVPMHVTLFLLVFGLSRFLLRSWWPGLVAATFTVSLPTAIAITSVSVGAGLTPIVYPSPSSVYAGAVMMALAHSILNVIRGRSAYGSWFSLTLLTLLAAGTKPTILPLAVSGTLVAAIYLLVSRRSVTRAACILGVLVSGFVLGGLMVTGGVAGSQVRLFGYFRSLKEFRTATGDDSVQGVTGSWAVPGVLDSGLAGWVLAFALLAALVLFHLPSLLGVTGVFLRSTRVDVAVWWLAGAVVASYGPFLIVDHMGSSQKYFLVTAFPLGMVLSVHLLAMCLPKPLSPALRRAVGGLVLCGILGASVSVALFANRRWTSIDVAATSLLVPVGVFVAMTGLVLVCCRVLSPKPLRTASGVTLVSALVLGWSIPHTLALTLGQATQETPHTAATAGPVLASSKQRGALWLAAHARTDDVIVTNAHCFRFTRDGCDARAFFLAAISGRRVYLEGWGYTPENALTRTRPNVDYGFQPSPWPKRLEQSDAAVTAPTQQLLGDLARRHGVRWIFADKTRDFPADRLDKLATLRYENRDVAIYDLHAYAR